LKITEVSDIFEILDSNDKFKHKIIQRLGWATFWAIFSQTHLVTLPRTRFFFWRKLSSWLHAPPPLLVSRKNSREGTRVPCGTCEIFERKVDLKKKFGAPTRDEEDFFVSSIVRDVVDISGTFNTFVTICC
jgi:hypothetical protein